MAQLSRPLSPARAPRGRGRHALRGDRGARLQRRRRQIDRQEPDPGLDRRQCDERSAVRAGGRSLRAADADFTPQAPTRISCRRGPREIVGPDQRRPCQFPPRRSRSGSARGLAHGHSGIGPGLSDRRQLVPRPSRDQQPGRRARSARAADLFGRRDPHPLRRSELHRILPRQPRVRARCLSARLFVDGHADDDLRLSSCKRSARGAESAGNPVWLRRFAICDRAADGGRARRGEGAGLDRLQEGLRKGRRRQALPLRLWRLRLRRPAGLQLQPHQPARPRLGLRDRPRPRRRRPWPSMVPRRQARQARQHVQRFRRRREGAGARRSSRGRDGSRSTADRPAEN